MSGLTLLNVDREREMLASLDSIEAVIRKENDYAAMAAALRELEKRDMPEAAEARRRIDRLHVQAIVRSGELIARLPKGAGRPAINSGAKAPEFTKAQALKDIGIKQRRASEREEAARVAEEAPEEFEEALASDEPKAAVSDLVRKRKKAKKRAQRDAKIIELSAANDTLNKDKTYPVIYADPPWRYEHIETESRAIENQYPTMALEEICAVPVADCCTPDAILFLWATSPKLEEALRVVEAWGFTYRTNMVWVKDKIGMGYYARQKHELLLICTRGNPPTPIESARPPSVIEARRGKHSAKPDVFAELIEKMYPKYAKLELFCRSPRPGWAVFGNESKVKEAS